MNLKFDAVGLFVTDMAKMVSFYRDVLGMKTEWNGKEPNAELEADGFRLIMFGRDDFEKMTSRKYAYPNGINGTMELAYEAESFPAVDTEFERVVRMGATPVMPPTTEPWGQRTCYVADPDGNLVEIGSFNQG
jgi:catechol 2,3-dioxygenase-like lactoylglutathione lyase family enzyme